MSRLERRYRRLLRWYPADHRAAHEDEMVGVLLDDAGPERERPDVRTVLDLIAGGLRLHARRLLPTPRTSEWQRAVALTQLCAPLAMLVIVGTQLHAALLTPPPTHPVLGALDAVRNALWILVAERALAGRYRAVAAVVAWCLVGWQVVEIVTGAGDILGTFGMNGWPLLVGALAAAALSVPVPQVPVQVLPGRHRLLVPASLVGAGLLAAVTGMAWSLVGASDIVVYAVFAVFLAAAIAGLLRGPALRRGTLLLLIPYAGTIALMIAGSHALRLDVGLEPVVDNIVGTLTMELGWPAALMAPLILGFAAVYGLYGLGRLLRVIPSAG